MRRFPGFWTAVEIGDRLEINRSCVYHLVSEGRLPSPCIPGRRGDPTPAVWFDEVIEPALAEVRLRTYPGKRAAKALTTTEFVTMGS